MRSSQWRLVWVASVTLAFGIGLGLLVAPGSGTTTDDPFEVGTTAAAAIPDTARVPYANAGDAAIAAALDQDPNLIDPQVTRIVGIHAGDQTVDLRVQVQADGFCHWYGVAGHVRNGVLEWRGGPAVACDG